MNHSKIIYFICCIFFSQVVLAQSSDGNVQATANSSTIKQEELPQFPGGEVKLTEFVDHTIVYPAKAKRKGNVGTSFISFIVKETGELAEIQTKKGLPGCSECDVEAMRMVKAMPLWIPGRKDGKAIPVQVVLPVRFSLK